MCSPRTCVPAVLLACAWAGPAEVGAADYRMKTEIRVDGQDEPVAENLTLFSGPVVYDFLLTEPEEIIVFDGKRGRFVLLAPDRRVQATVTTEEIEQFAAAMRACDAEGALSFLLRPEFRVEMDEETGWLTLSSKQLTYRVKGVEPKWPEAVRRCRQFADGCARLNALRPGNLPPFPRIEVNKAVAQKGWIPTEVERSIQLGKGLSSGKHLARSRHSVIWQLSNKDRERIAEADRHQANFRAVSLDEYQRLTAAPARDGASQP